MEESQGKQIALHKSEEEKKMQCLMWYLSLNFSELNNFEYNIEGTEFQTQIKMTNYKLTVMIIFKL